MFLKFLDPSLNILKRFSVINSIGYDHPRSSLVVGSCNVFKSLLTCCVSDLQFYSFPINFHNLLFTINTWKKDSLKRGIFYAGLPIVSIYYSVKNFSENLSNRLVFPTDESPMIKSLTI